MGIEKNEYAPILRYLKAKNVTIKKVDLETGQKINTSDVEGEPEEGAPRRARGERGANNAD